jgi:hypothetical protein
MKREAKTNQRFSSSLPANLQVLIFKMARRISSGFIDGELALGVDTDVNW